MSTIAENLKHVKNIISETAIRCGRDPHEITLMAVSKTKPMGMLVEAYNAGMRLFGENRVQEAVEKRKKLPLDAEIQLIGHLQSNKTKASVGNFSCIQSVDSLKIARKINKEAEDKGLVQKILIELKTSEEESKGGFSSEDEYFESLGEIMSMKNIEVQGLMTIAPFVEDDEVVRSAFKKCRLVFEKTKILYPHKKLSVLSMGMSNDFPIAIEEGSTLIRVGSLIFGTRY